MIASFRDPETEAVASGTPVRRFGQIVERARNKLRIIEAAVTLEDLRVPPGNRLERLRGDRSGPWSIRINDQWRICFEWRAGRAWKIEIVDHH